MVLNFDVCDNVLTKPALTQNGGVLLGDRSFDQELVQTRSVWWETAYCWTILFIFDFYCQTGARSRSLSGDF